MDSHVNVPSYTARLDRQDQTQVYCYSSAACSSQWQQHAAVARPRLALVAQEPAAPHTLELLFDVFLGRRWSHPSRTGQDHSFAGQLSTPCGSCERPGRQKPSASSGTGAWRALRHDGA
jgi:hypothetical protein